ncbi:hypothetical protein IEQ34_021940 [Dendrobium chrysotoxum]|uniref:Uncharacterized protein n=1 Tax=Dendrobium chrysotoxum TaxID=161865 RepID=A0AAV7FJX9_DENCH|nr:hypothetical protein IEQ34_021940 [Dendrobium chrysotoxum]
MTITLWDLYVISGLPILGVLYEECIPVDYDLFNHRPVGQQRRDLNRDGILARFMRITLCSIRFENHPQYLGIDSTFVNSQFRILNCASKMYYAVVHRCFDRWLPYHQVINFLDLLTLGKHQPLYMRKLIIIEMIRTVSKTQHAFCCIGLFHQLMERSIISFTSTFTYSTKYEYNSVSFGNVVDQFYDEYYFTHSSSLK